MRLADGSKSRLSIEGKRWKQKRSKNPLSGILLFAVNLCNMVSIIGPSINIRIPTFLTV